MVLVQDKEINMLGSLMYSFQEFRKAAELIMLKIILKLFKLIISLSINGLKPIGLSKTLIILL